MDKSEKEFHYMLSAFLTTKQLFLFFVFCICGIMAEVKERVVNRREFCIPDGFLPQGKQRGGDSVTQHQHVAQLLK
jgi:hypothetical protein